MYCLTARYNTCLISFFVFSYFVLCAGFQNNNCVTSVYCLSFADVSDELDDSLQDSDYVPNSTDDSDKVH